MRRGIYGRFLNTLLLLLLTVELVGARAARPAAPSSVPWVASPKAPSPVPWAQAWPMVGHDPRRTARGATVGPLHPHLLWTYRGLDGPPLIGRDGRVYGWGRAGFTAIDAGGQRRWIAPVQQIEGGPAALGPDGLLRMNAEPVAAQHAAGLWNEPHMAIVALSPAGRPVWTLRSLPWATVPRSVPFSKGEAPLVTPANLLYMPFVGPVYRPGQNDGVEVVTASGLPLRRLLPGWSGPIAVARDGVVYEVGGDSQGHMAVLASQSDGRFLWSHALAYEQWGSVLVGQDGTVYVSDGAGAGAADMGLAAEGEVVAYTPLGRLLWRLHTAGVATLAERGDGVVLIGDQTGLSAVSPRGRRLWRYAFKAPTANGAPPSLAVDAARRAYVGGVDGMIRAIAPDGTRLWTLRAGGPSHGGAVPSIALGPAGRLAVIGTDGVLRVYR